MAAVREHGAPRVNDPARITGVDAVGVDETAFQAAAATRSTSFVTGIVDLTRARGPARLLDVVEGRSASASLSRFLCKSISGWSGEVGPDAVGVGQGEGAEGLFPALDDGAFDEPAGGGALVGG